MNSAPAPSQYTARWHHRAAIWLGIALNPASITLGGGVAERVPSAVLWWLLPLSCFLLTLLVTTAGVIGRRRRENLSRWSAAIFGAGIGAFILNLLMALGMVGWNGFQLGLSGTSLSRLLSTPGWVGIVLIGIIAFTLSTFEVNRWNTMVWITTGSSVAVALVAIVVAQNQSAATTPAEPLTFATALWSIGTIISFAALFSLRITDFTWDMASDRDVMIDGFAFFLVLLGATVIGAYLYLQTGEWDLTVIFRSTSLALLGHLFIVLSLLAPSLSTIHSGGLAWEHVLPINFRAGTILLVACGMLLGLTRFDQRLLPFLDWIGAILPPAMAILMTMSLIKRPIRRNWILIAWAAGAAVGLALKLNGQIVHLFAGSSTSLLVLALAALASRPDHASR